MGSSGLRRRTHPRIGCGQIRWYPSRGSRACFPLKRNRFCTRDAYSLRPNGLTFARNVPTSVSETVVTSVGNSSGPATLRKPPPESSGWRCLHTRVHLFYAAHARTVMKPLLFALSFMFALSGVRAQEPVWQPSPGHTQILIWPGEAPDQQPGAGPEESHWWQTGPGGPGGYGVSRVSRPTMPSRWHVRRCKRPWTGICECKKHKFADLLP